MFHKVTILGNLGQDPDTRVLQNGNSVCSFSVATNRDYTLSNGERVKETVWWRVSAWGKLGEICQQYLTKGQKVFLEGRMQADRESGSPRIWTDQNGQARASFELTASTMKMLSSRGDSGGYGGGGGYNQNYAPQQSRGAPQQQQYAPQQRAASAPAPQRAAPPVQQQQQQQYAGPPQRQAPPQRAQQAPRRGDRRSTMSAPQANDFGDDDFGPDEIPF